MLSLEAIAVAVSKLELVKFSQLFLHEKVGIKTSASLSPDTQISQSGISNNTRYNHSFNSAWYLKKR